MKNKLSFILALILTFNFGCTQKPNKNERISPVVLADIEQKDVPIYLEAIGNVYSLQTVQIRPQVSGIIEEAYVKQGQYVKKGDPLYKIDPRPYQAALDKAKATLAKDTATLKYSENQLERNTQLVKKDFISKLSYEQYQSQVELNKAQIQTDLADVAVAELNLSWCEPISPLDGKISQYKIDPGNLVVANDVNALTDIRQITPADIRFSLSQNDYFKVKKAKESHSLKFEVILPQEVSQMREGSIYFIDNHLDTNTGTLLFKGTVPNEDELLWPGEFIRVRLLLGVEKDALLVPEEAVKIGQEGPYVYIYSKENSTAEYRKVIKGEKFHHKVVIVEGVTLGEKVIVQGQNNLLPGSKVKITNGQVPKQATP